MRKLIENIFFSFSDVNFTNRIASWQICFNYVILSFRNVSTFSYKVSLEKCHSRASDVTCITWQKFYHFSQHFFTFLGGVKKCMHNSQNFCRVLAQKMKNTCQLRLLQQQRVLFAAFFQWNPKCPRLTLHISQSDSRFCDGIQFQEENQII